MLFRAVWKAERPTTQPSRAYAAADTGLCAASMSQANICVYFTDLQALKQLCELTAECWYRRAGWGGGRRRRWDDNETEIELE